MQHHHSIFCGRSWLIRDPKESEHNCHLKAYPFLDKKFIAFGFSLSMNHSKCTVSMSVNVNRFQKIQEYKTERRAVSSTGRQRKYFSLFTYGKKIIENSSPKKFKKKLLSKPICKREKKIVRAELYTGLSLRTHEIFVREAITKQQSGGIFCLIISKVVSQILV